MMTMKRWLLLLLLPALVACQGGPPPADTVGAMLDAMASNPPMPVGDLSPEDMQRAVTHPQTAVANKDTRSRADIEAAACGWPEHWYCSRPRPKTFMAGPASSPIIPNSWTVASWAFDPLNTSGCASDTNTCTSASCGGGGSGPCASWGEIWVHRLGAGTPQLQQVTTFTQVSSQNPGTDSIFGTFQLANGAQAILLGQLRSIGTIAINTAIVTTQSRGAPGTRWAVTSMPGGTVANELLQDTTQNTWSVIDSVSVGTATISQPIPNSVVSTVGIPTFSQGSMATNDAFTVWAQPLSNLKAWRVTGGDVGSGGANSAACSAWVQNLEIADSSNNQTSEYPMVTDAANTTLSNVRVDGRLHYISLNGRVNAGYWINDVVVGVVSTFAGQLQVGGGILRGGAAFDSQGLTLGNDVVVHGSVSSALSVTMGAGGGGVFADGTWTFGGGSQGVLIPSGIWGSFSFVVNPNGVVWDTAGGWNNLQTSGTLRFGSNATGCFVSGLDAGLITCNVPLDISHLQSVSGNALYDPASGARFSQSQ